MGLVADIVKRDIGAFDRATLGLTIVPRADAALVEDEEPLRVATGQLPGNRKFVLVLLTNRRVLVVRGGMTMGITELPLDQISAVSTSLTKLTISTGGREELDIRAVGGVEEFAGSIRQAMGGSRAPHAASQAVGGAPDPYEQLRKLGELRDAGVLTSEEFAEKKAQLLARM